MSSYQQEYLRGLEDGKKEFRKFDDKSATVYYHLTKVFEYLGIENQPKLVDKYKTYILGEADSING